MSYSMEELMNTGLISKTVIQYLKKYGESEFVFNIHLQDKYKTPEKLCAECLKQNKTIKELEPVFSQIKT